MSNIYDEDDNIDYINVEQQNLDFVVQPSLKSLVSSTKYLNRKVHKYKSEKERIKQLEHDVYDEDGHINTGSITLHEGSKIEYEITEETDPKALVPKQYVDDHTNIDVNETLHLKNSNVSLETDGAIQVGNNGSGTSIETTGNIIVKDSNDNIVITLSNDGKIKANNIEVVNGKRTGIILNEDDIVNRSYVDNIFNDKYLSKTDLNLQTVEGPINFENAITIDNGTINNNPENEKDITNKNYVDTTIEHKALLKDKNIEQTVNGPVKFNNTTKIYILSLQIVE